MAAQNPELIAHLNAILKIKLTGINQYFLHARMLKHQGEVKLADYEYKSSIVIMKHSDMLVEHILSLGGFPNLQELSQLMIGETVLAMLENDLVLSESALESLNHAIAFCDANAVHKDCAVTAALLRKIQEGQMEHIDFLHQQLNSLEPLKQKDCA